jgi:hypothetical protein
MPESIRIATRKSPLALWQAGHVASVLRRAHADLRVEIVAISTRGDKILDAPLAKIGGKGLFVKELEQGMLEGRADIAVHSMKDVPADLPHELHLAVIMEREDPRDALVSNRYSSLSDLPAGASVGTSSLRRSCQLAERRPDLRIKSLRGNINTRLSKLDAGDYDAVVLAAAGLVRMGFEERIRIRLEPEESLPGVIDIPQHASSSGYPDAQTLVAQGDSCCFGRVRQDRSGMELMTDESIVVDFFLELRTPQVGAVWHFTRKRPSGHQSQAIGADLCGGAACAAISDGIVGECRPRKTEQVADDQQPVGERVGQTVAVHVERVLDLIDIGRDRLGVAAGAAAADGPVGQRRAGKAEQAPDDQCAVGEGVGDAVAVDIGQGGVAKGVEF